MIDVNNRLLISGLGFLGALAVFGFAILRYMNGALFMAVFDGVLACIFLAVSCYTYYTGKQTLGRYAISVVAVIGSILTTVLNISTGPYWVYVTIVVIFYLLPYRQAMVLSAFTALMLLVLLYGPSDRVQLLHFLGTIVLITVFSFLFALNMERTNLKLEALSLKDDLTGAGNRRAFVKKVDEAVNLFKRFGFPSCLIYMDVDHFKMINDSQGHAQGDKVLTMVANCLGIVLRETDRLYRIGGDEFVVVVEGGVQVDSEYLAEKLRQMIESKTIVPGVAITLSLGVAEIKAQDTPDDWISRADDALYLAKGQGRNQVAGIEAKAS